MQIRPHTLLVDVRGGVVFVGDVIRRRTALPGVSQLFNAAGIPNSGEEIQIRSEKRADWANRVRCLFARKDWSLKRIDGVEEARGLGDTFAGLDHWNGAEKGASFRGDFSDKSSPPGLLRMNVFFTNHLVRQQEFQKNIKKLFQPVQMPNLFPGVAQSNPNH